MKLGFIAVLGLVWLSTGAILTPEAMAQSYQMTLHFTDGDTLTLGHDQVSRIEFVLQGSGVGDDDAPPHAFRLLGNYPNPFNPLTTIAYEIPGDTPVKVAIYNLHGGLVRELLSEGQSAGRHTVVWDGTDMHGGRAASGVYLYAVQTSERTLSRQLILVK